jgi:hypothetical protein
MRRLLAAIALASLCSFPALAQRLDGCPGRQSGLITLIDEPSAEAVEQGLRDSGIDTPGALKAALRSDRPDLRSLAALELGRRGDKADLDPLAQASIAETDQCTRFHFANALGMMAHALRFDPAEHNGLRPWIEPFKPCNPSEPPMAQLKIAPAASAGSQSPTVEISVRNLTAKMLPFVVAVPEELFSVSAFDANGTPVPAKGMLDPRSPPPLMETTASMLFLPPGKDTHFWTWKIGDDFDLSNPGVYHVSLGGRLAYLDTTVCSNTAEITVVK